MKFLTPRKVSVHEVENLQPVNLKLYNTKYTILMISHALQIPKVPMWVGSKSLISDYDHPKQIVSYLTLINSSSTNTSEVLETMTQSANLSRLTTISNLSYLRSRDCKIALQVQTTEKQTFDNLFIHLGPFHIIMTYSKALVEVIINRGLPNVMVPSNMLAMGSLN